MAKPAKPPKILSLKASTKAYEDWMRARLGRLIVETDLDRKHDKMRESPFVFLRATFWRWAEIVPGVCPDLMSAPSVLAVGDLHVENYGTWRDAEGRLVWGINDFDEASEMPYALDLARLATSALLAGSGTVGAKPISEAILSGYVAGLEAPRPIVLDHDWRWLRELVVVSEEARAKFWKRLAKAVTAGRGSKAPKVFQAALAAAFPGPCPDFVTTPRTAGAGSLGRPRWVGIADWQGAPAVREAKALLPSAWPLAQGRANVPLRCHEAATGPHRSIDPWYRVEGKLVVRRLSPNNRKIDSAKERISLLSRDMLQAMGREIANIHAADRGSAEAIKSDIAGRLPGWLAASAKAAASATETDYREWIR